MYVLRPTDVNGAYILPHTSLEINKNGLRYIYCSAPFFLSSAYIADILPCQYILDAVFVFVFKGSSVLGGYAMSYLPISCLADVYVLQSFELLHVTM